MNEFVFSDIDSTGITDSVNAVRSHAVVKETRDDNQRESEDILNC